MTLRHDARGEEATVVHRWDGGLTWMAHPDEGMQRASHALVVDGEVWLVDPFDAGGSTRYSPRPAPSPASSC